MKRIDLHIHTKPANYENKFDFSIDKMVEYVNNLKLDIIAITNHNLFDRNNFDEIKRNINIKVFPGVEIDIEKGHLLLIADESLIDELELSCAKLSLEITNNTLGMLMKPDMLIYTYHDGDVFDIYEGEFGAKELVNSTGKTINSFDKIIDVMEAGEIAYKERKNIYEDIKN